MNRRELEMLLQDLFEGILEGGDFDTLEAELRENPEARATYRKYLLLDTALTFRHSGSDLLQVVPMDQVNERQHRRLFRQTLLSAAAIVALMMVAMALVISRKPPPTLTFKTSPDSDFAVSHRTGSEAPPSGNVLEPGSRLVVTKGTVELEFASGVRGIVQAPADFTLQRADLVEMAHGTAWFDVSPEAIGFQVTTPDFRLTDLGTRFGIISKEGFLDQVHVFKGEVLGESLDGLREQSLVQEGQARFSNPDGQWKETALLNDSFLWDLPDKAPEISSAVEAKVTLEAVDGNPHLGPAIFAVSGDLLETVGSVASSRQTRPYGKDSHLTSGTIETGINTIPEDVFKGGGSPAAFIEFDLDTASNPAGFDIFSLRTIAYWTDMRSQQAWAVQFRRPGGSYSEFYKLEPTDGFARVTLVELSDTSGKPLATNVTGIRFHFDNAASNWTAYREIDAIGKPSK